MYDPINNVKTVVFPYATLSLLISNANKRAVKTYEVEVSVRKALFMTLHAAQSGSRRIAALCLNFGVRQEVAWSPRSGRSWRRGNPLSPPGLKTQGIKALSESLHRVRYGSKISVI